MAISEATKQAVMDYKSRLKVRLETLDRDIASHQASINALTAQKAAITSQVNALQVDIPEPTPVEMPK
jgi:cell division protein FtsB